MTIKITHEERVKLLKCHNDVKNILQTIYDCHDLFISDIAKLERVQSELCNIGKFKHGSNHYEDFVFIDEDDD